MCCFSFALSASPASPLVELEPPHVVRPQDFRPDDHLHAVLRFAEDPRSRLAEGILVLDDRAEVAHDVARALARGDAGEQRALDAVGQFAMDVTRKRQVVLREEIEGVRVHDGEALRGELVDAARREVFVKGQGRIRQLTDATADTVAEGVPGAAPPDQGLLALQPREAVRDFRLELLQALQRRELVVRKRGRRTVLADARFYLILGLLERLRELRRDLGGVPVARHQRLLGCRPNMCFQIGRHEHVFSMGSAVCRMVPKNGIIGCVNNKHRKTLAAIFAKNPGNNLRWGDVEALLMALNARRVEGAGSRVTFLLNDVMATFHRPHPEPTVRKGALKAVRIFLSEAGIKP